MASILGSTVNKASSLTQYPTLLDPLGARSSHSQPGCCGLGARAAQASSTPCQPKTRSYSLRSPQQYSFFPGDLGTKERKRLQPHMGMQPEQNHSLWDSFQFELPSSCRANSTHPPNNHTSANRRVWVVCVCVCQSLLQRDTPRFHFENLDLLILAG